MGAYGTHLTCIKTKPTTPELIQDLWGHGIHWTLSKQNPPPQNWWWLYNLKKRIKKMVITYSLYFLPNNQWDWENYFQYQGYKTKRGLLKCFRATRMQIRINFWDYIRAHPGQILYHLGIVTNLARFFTSLSRFFTTLARFFTTLARFFTTLARFFPYIF